MKFHQDDVPERDCFACEERGHCAVVLEPGETCGRAPVVRPCERCQEERPCMDIPMHGYTLWLCRQCAAAAYRSGEAV